jgi:hypothetical protein
MGAGARLRLLQGAGELRHASAQTLLLRLQPPGTTQRSGHTPRWLPHFTHFTHFTHQRPPPRPAPPAATR